MDEPDRGEQAATSDAPKETSDDIIEEPVQYPLFDMRWEDVENHDLSLDGLDDRTSLSMDLRGRDMPVMVVVVPYLECPQAAAMAQVSGLIVTTSNGEHEHSMEWWYHDVAQCTGQDRSRPDSYSILTAYDCLATTWTVDVEGNGPGAGAEVRIQRPVDQVEAQRLIENEKAERGDPCVA